MAQKADDDYLKLFEGIEEQPDTTTKPSAENIATQQSEQDILAELDYLTAERPKAAVSRPHTPRLAPSPSTKSFERSRTPAGRNSGEGYGYGLPPSRRDSGDTGMKKAERSSLDIVSPATPSTGKEARQATVSGSNAESSISGSTGDATSATPAAAINAATGSGVASGGWGWGSIWSTATAAVKTAEGMVKEIQQSEEGKKWASQVKGNAEVLRGLAGDVRSRAIPTFTTLLHTLAPPISSHEQLRIHITHDLENYPFIDNVVYGVFDRVMQQVEGGDLLVVQRGGGSKPRSSLDTVFSGGPWWKGMEKRNLNATLGLEEGVKLARAATDSYSQEFASKSDTISDIPSKDNPTRKSNIFLAIQPTVYTQQPIGNLGVSDEKEEKLQVIVFAIHLYDPVNSLSFSTVSQALPAQWLEWLDAPAPKDTQPGDWALPEVIRNMVDMGGIDPREWIVEWVEEAVGLAVGVVAQKYVAKRMRVGDSIGEPIIEKEGGGGGEEARAIGL